MSLRLSKLLLVTVCTVAVAAVTGCGADELSTSEACAEVRSPVEEAMGEADVGGAADVLRDVAEQGDAEVRRVFVTAADAADFVADNGNEAGVPAWVTAAFNDLDAACNLGEED